MIEEMPIACALDPQKSKERFAWIGLLNADALLRHERQDLELRLHYAPQARSRIREMVREEQKCCAFLKFDLRESTHEIVLTISAPEHAREAADGLFEQFLVTSQAPASATACGCAPPKKPSEEAGGSKAASAAAMTFSTGAIACGACCVLPFTLPATVLASTGSFLSSLVHMHWWMTVLSIIAVVGAWAWIGRQIRRTGRKPATIVLVMMIASTIFTTASIMWPLIEKPLIRV